MEAKSSSSNLNAVRKTKHFSKSCCQLSLIAQYSPVIVKRSPYKECRPSDDIDAGFTSLIQPVHIGLCYPFSKRSAETDTKISKIIKVSCIKRQICQKFLRLNKNKE